MIGVIRVMKTIRMRWGVEFEVSLIDFNIKRAY